MSPIEDSPRQPDRTAARRHRQVGEIVTLLIDGCHQRAEGLALLHIAEFPDDAPLLGQITREAPA